MKKGNRDDPSHTEYDTMTYKRVTKVTKTPTETKRMQPTDKDQTLKTDTQQGTQNNQTNGHKVTKVYEQLRLH